MLWLIGGTSESAAIARILDARQIPYCITVTTENARSLYGPEAQVWVGAIEVEAMPQFIQSRKISKVLDASHPFATAVSQGAIAAAESCSIPYLRFERPPRQLQAEGSSQAEGSNTVSLLNLAMLLQPQWLEGSRTLLVLGYRMLAQLKPWQKRARLYARILPSQVALNSALAAGFTPNRLIALRPPVSPELEAALWRQWEITQVVAKASGTAGGENVKRAIAQQLGVRLILIDRPAVGYPRQTQEIAIALDFAGKSPPTPAS